MIKKLKAFINYINKVQFKKIYKDGDDKKDYL